MHAIIHTTGVVLGKTYVPLELSYIDVTGYEIHLQITSPMSYHEATTQYSHIRPDAIMSTYRGVALDKVISFLNIRYQQLQQQFPDTLIVFGHKGNGTQLQFLQQTQIPHLENVEQLGVPALHILAEMYPSVTIPPCSLHVKCFKCSRAAVRLIAAHMFQ